MAKAALDVFVYHFMGRGGGGRGVGGCRVYSPCGMTVPSEWPNRMEGLRADMHEVRLRQSTGQLAHECCISRMGQGRP